MPPFLIYPPISVNGEGGSEVQLFSGGAFPLQFSRMSRPHGHLSLVAAHRWGPGAETVFVLLL